MKRSAVKVRAGVFGCVLASVVGSMQPLFSADSPQDVEVKESSPGKPLLVEGATPSGMHAVRFDGSGNYAEVPSNPEDFDGDIAAILVYNRSLSLSERNAVEDYLHHTYLSVDFDLDEPADPPVVDGLVLHLNGLNAIAGEGSVTRLQDLSDHFNHADTYCHAPIPSAPGIATIEPEDIPNEGLLFVDHGANDRSGHGGHAITEAQNGDIIAFYPNTSPTSWGGHSVSGWAEYKISEDGGESWSAPYVLDYSKEIWEGEEFHSALVDEIMTAPNGTLVAIVRRYTDYRWGADTCVFLRSYDHGRTWSEAREVDPAGSVPRVVRDEASLVYDEVLYVLFRDLPAERHRLYVSTDNGERFKERSVLPFARLQGYGAMTVLDGGDLIAYTYNPDDEHYIQYSISGDDGRTWSDVETTYLAKRIRNPQLSEKIGGYYFMHGRSGQWGDDPRHLVLYTSRDGINWEEGVFLNKGATDDLDSYSTNAIVGRHDPEEPERLLIQSSIAYDESGRRVNVHHWWIQEVAGMQTKGVGNCDWIDGVLNPGIKQ